MEAYLVFDLRLAYELIKDKNFYKSKRIIFITDKIVIYNLLKSSNFKKAICLDSEISDLERKKFFLKEYSFFDRKLEKFGKKNHIVFKKTKVNSIYNTYKLDVPRYYVGVKILLFTLNKVLRKKKITKIVFFGDLRNNTLNELFYTKIFEYFCKKNKILLECRENIITKRNFLHNLFKKIYFIFHVIREISLQKILNKFRKKFSKILINKSLNNVLFIEPKADLNFVIAKRVNIFNYNPKKLNDFKKCQNFKSSEFKSYVPNNIDEIFLEYLKEKNIFLRSYFLGSIKDILNFLNKKNIKEIFWGLSPLPSMRNTLFYLKKKIPISGLQHGGKYFIMQDDICHKDSDYSYCNKYYSYGLTRSFNKKKYSKNTQIINSGCFKDTFFNDIMKKKISLKPNTILYVPVSLSYFTFPVIEARPTTRFEIQKKICSNLEKLKNFKKFVKIIPLSFFKNFIFNLSHIETNPIYLELNNYKSLKINSRSLNSAYKLIKPRIIITDYLSTPIYELSNSGSEIILFLDKYNYPKKDILKILNKRFFIVKNVVQMKKAIKLIINEKQKKNNNKIFYEKFYKEKNSLFQ